MKSTRMTGGGGRGVQEGSKQKSLSKNPVVPLVVIVLGGLLFVNNSKMVSLMQKGGQQFEAATHLNYELLARQRSELVCGNPRGAEWSHLCNGKFLEAVNNDLMMGKDIYLVQIGAHVSFEKNDPFAEGAAKLLFNLTKEEKKRFHWIFVEPSPPNYKRLVQNLQNRSDWCDLSSINAAVVPDGTPDASSMIFHSFSPDIDPETGYDSRSGKTFPHWVTQISGLTMGPLLFNKGLFERKGLKLEDYVVDSNVTVYPYSELMNIATGGQAPHLVLIDTEGFDCNIILGIYETSNYLPHYLIFEKHQCGGMKQPTFDYLRELGYGFVRDIKCTQNAIAIRNLSVSL